MPLQVVGVNHNTAPLDVRSRVAFAESEASTVLSALQALPGVDECIVLSTCNRTEVYVHASRDPTSDILRSLCGIKGLPVAMVSASCVSLDGIPAVRHVFRVAAGLESMLVGEGQILGQVRRAYQAARKAHTAGPVLNRAMQLALGTGRRVRRETALGRANVSAAHAALLACRQTFGSIDGRHVLIVGAGEMAALALKIFVRAGARVTAVANRDLAAAQTLASRVNARAIPLDDIPQSLPETDAVIVAVGASNSVLRHDHVEQSSNRVAALMVFDLGLPPAVAPDVASLPGVVVYDLDRLSALLPPVPDGAVAAAGRLVDQAVDRFIRWYASRAAQPIVAGLRRRADEIAELAYQRLQPRLQSLDPRGRAQVRGAMHTALRQLLHGPTVRLKEAAADRRVLELAKDIFDLNDEDGQR